MDMETMVSETRTHMATLVMQLNRGVVPEKEKKAVKEVFGAVELADKLTSGKSVALTVSKEEKAAAVAKAAQEVLANNRAKRVIVDVPSLDVLNHAALGYVQKHGRGALETRLAQYHVKRG
jgi:hypothetical protein